MSTKSLLILIICTSQSILLAHPVRCLNADNQSAAVPIKPDESPYAGPTEAPSGLPDLDTSAPRVEAADGVSDQPTTQPPARNLERLDGADPTEPTANKKHLEEARDLENRRAEDSTSAATSGPPTDSPAATDANTKEAPTTAPPPTPPPTDNNTNSSAKEVPECIKDTYCLHGGTCVVNEHKQMICICPEEYYGARCQTKNICKTIIHDSLTGDQICAQIERECLRNDKFFRCECHADEFFIFKAEQPTAGQPAAGSGDANNRDSTIAYDSLLPLVDVQQYLNNQQLHRELDLLARQEKAKQQQRSYIAQCRKIDKCLGVRCRQMSEVCREGECVCNQDLGYTPDPSDGLCKLLDPCRMPVPADQSLPICGQARCVATYDKELYRCICPIGYKAVKKDEHKNSTQCALFTNNICRIPLLNKCQHICKVDRFTNSYKCSCFHGYKPGARAGIDDHMCFFDEHPEQSQQYDTELSSAGALGQYSSRSANQASSPSSSSSARSSGADGFVYRAYSPDELYAKHNLRPRDTSARHRFAYDKSPPPAAPDDNAPEEQADFSNSGDQTATRSDDDAAEKSSHRRNVVIKREPVGRQLGGDKSGQPPISRVRRTRSANSGDYYDSTGGNNIDYMGGADDDELDGLNLNLLTAQERCNMYCEDNKICVLEQNSKDSYKCVCDRQGYVSIGDRCLDWCSAAEFSHYLMSLLEQVCYSGICKPSDTKPMLNRQGGLGAQGASSFHETDQMDEATKFKMMLRESSWRPTFECDCSTSPLLEQDPETRLCKLNFGKIINPCLPGNEGYNDCVHNKSAYCAVLHRPTSLFFKDLQRDQPAAPAEAGKSADSRLPPSSAGDSSEKAKKAAKLAKDKLYTCVCSPEKKFLVDKPRNKARCINECDLLNNECGRFNRMCRAATIDPEEFSRRSSELNLVGYDFIDNVYRMSQFKRTGCECLPGFNVGPSESVDFFLDNDYQGDPFEQDGLPAFVPTPVATLGGGLLGPAVLDPYAAAHQHDQQHQPAANLQDQASIVHGELFGGQNYRTKYMNINSRCLLDYDVIEFHATFKAPPNFEPIWVKIRNTVPLDTTTTGSKLGAKQHSEATEEKRRREESTVEKEIKGDSPLLDPESTTQLPDAAAAAARLARGASDRHRGGGQMHHEDVHFCATSEECLLKVPSYMRTDIAEFHRSVVLVAQCDIALTPLSVEAYQECIRYRYWVVQKLRNHFADWRRIVAKHLKGTFDLMDGNIRLRVNKCEATIKRLTTVPEAFAESMESSPVGWTNQPFKSTAGQSSGESESRKAQTQSSGNRHQQRGPSQARHDDQQAAPQFAQRQVMYSTGTFDALDHYALIDADIDCELTIHSANDETSSRHTRKVLLEKQLPKLIFNKQRDANFGQDYYLMAPEMLVQRDSIDQLPKHRKVFSPCKSEYAYCDSQTRCEMVDTVNFSCTCEYGYTPIGSRDIYQGDSRKEVCEDIDECLFDVCKENGLENNSICVNEIGDYKCKCIRHHVGDDKRYCNHICNIIACKYGDCRIPDEHHAYCECYEGYREADCSVQDPSVALRKANMIICGSIFASVLLLAITLAISLNSQLKKTKKKLKRLEAASDAAQLFELPHQQPFRPRLSKVSAGS